MATATAPTLRTDTRGFASWFADFLRSELAPYPGRGTLVARMVISATITMVIIMIFRIPGGAIGPLYAFTISRENLQSTAKSSLYVLIAFAMCAVTAPLGARMFGSIPFTHFLWEGVSIFVIFFLIRTLSNFTISSGLALIGTSVLGIWYLPGPADHNVSRTLWAVLAPTIGAVVTFSVEAVFHAINKQDEIVLGVNRRLRTIEEQLHCYAAGETLPATLHKKLTQEAMIGVSRMRSQLARSNARSSYRAKMNAIVSLTGRSIDFAAALAHTTPILSSPQDREIAAELASHLATVERSIASGATPPALARITTSESLPLLRELAEMFSLIPKVLEGSASVEAFDHFSNSFDPQKNIFIPDAFRNPAHLRYALSGCLAGMICYCTYMMLDWHGLATSVTTCALTALTTIGASRQKQFLRIIGAVIGGFVFGMGTQIMVLPWINGIGGFMLLFAIISAIAAWIGTASTRLSYCGIQIALAYYLINVNDFRINLSLSIARDRALGVLLGVFAMWLVYERMHPKSAVRQMVETFTRNLNLLGELSMVSLTLQQPATIAQVQQLRARIYENFGSVNAQADAIPFEIGPLRSQHMAARDRIRRWQATLRSYYLLELALLQYTAFTMTQRLTDDSREQIRTFDQCCADRLSVMGEHLQTQTEESLEAIMQNQRSSWPDWMKTGSILPGILPMANELAEILDRLWDEMAAAPLYAVEQ